jgi:dTDP-4-dehydrorhamnose 3,5-epimerase
MELIHTTLQDCFILKPTVFRDSRGYFYESFNKRRFQELTGIEIDFVQDNEALSNYGSIRGLHFQKGDHAQAKLVRVTSGKVLDVVVDLRPDSPTFKKSFSIELTASNNLQLFVPRGFAHGYAVLEDQTVFFYKCDNYYNKEAEGGIAYNDPTLNIDWQIPAEDRLISEKDSRLNFLD